MSNETPDRLGLGGQRRQLFQIEALLHAGIDVEVMTLAGPQEDTSVRELTRVRRVRRRLPRGVPNPLAWRSIERAARSGRYTSVVVAHTESWGLLGDDPGSLPTPVLLDAHNVLSDWHARLGDPGTAAELARTERRILEHAQAVAVCSSTELDRLPVGGAAHRFVLPHGVDLSEWPDPPPLPEAPAVVMFGSWDWLPNERGLLWYLHEVWPTVLAAVPEARCRVAGRGVPPEALGVPGVEYVGRVARLDDFTADATVVAVPVLEGVGASLKLGDSLASGRPVIATRDGASAHPQSPARVSDDPAEWADTLARWLKDPQAAAEAGAATRAFALEHLTWRETSRPLIQWARTTAT